MLSAVYLNLAFQMDHTLARLPISSETTPLLVLKQTLDSSRMKITKDIRKSTSEFILQLLKEKKMQGFDVERIARDPIKYWTVLLLAIYTSPEWLPDLLPENCEIL